MSASRWKRELAIAAGFLGCGLLLLPPAVYWVGQELVGDYAADGGMGALADQFWSDLLRFEPAAWLLVLSPYVVLQLIRLIGRAWRPRSM